eukprot:SAG11_NODE_29360_length_311_cov_1.943396_2_plen_40_part_01
MRPDGFGGGGRTAARRPTAAAVARLKRDVLRHAAPARPVR